MNNHSLFDFLKHFSYNGGTLYFSLIFMTPHISVQDTTEITISNTLSRILSYEDFLKYGNLCAYIRNFLTFSRMSIDMDGDEKLQSVLRVFDSSYSALRKEDFFYEFDGATLIASPNFLIMLDMLFRWEYFLIQYGCYALFLKPLKNPIPFYRLFGDFYRTYSAPDGSDAAQMIEEYSILSDNEKGTKKFVKFGRELLFQEMITEVVAFQENILIQGLPISGEYIEFLSQFTEENILEVYENQYIMEYIFFLNVL